MLMPTITPTTYTRCVVYYGACISELAINSPKKSLTRCGVRLFVDHPKANYFFFVCVTRSLLLSGQVSTLLWL